MQAKKVYFGAAMRKHCYNPAYYASHANKYMTAILPEDCALCIYNGNLNHYFAVSINVDTDETVTEYEVDMLHSVWRQRPYAHGMEWSVWYEAGSMHIAENGINR